jgi:CHAT domain-containing protein
MIGPFKYLLIICLFLTSQISNSSELSASEVISKNSLHFNQILKLIDSKDKKGIENKLISIIQDEKISSDKQLLDYSFIILSIEIIKKFDCQNDSKFIFNFLTATSKNKTTSSVDIQKIILIEDIIKDFKKNKKLDDSCLNTLYETVLDAAKYEALANNSIKNFKTVQIIEILNRASDGLLFEDKEKLKFNIYYYFFISNLISSKNNRIKNEGLDYYQELKKYHNQFINEKIIIENENFFLETKNTTEDSIFFNKLTYLTKYLKEDHWPFKFSKTEYINNLYKKKFKDKVKRDFFLLATSEVLIKHLNEKTPREANLVYKEILNININNLPKEFKSTYRELLPLMLDGFKLRAALQINDLKNAEKIFNSNLSKIYSIKSNASIRAFNENNPDSFAILISPYFNYSIFMKDAINANLLIKLVNENVDFDLSKIEDEEYINQSKLTYKNKLNTYLLMNEDYLEFIGEDKYKINKIYRAFYPYAFREFHNYLKSLMSNLSSYNIDSAQFYLDIYKEDLPNFNQSKSKQLIVELYKIFSNALKAYPGDESSSEEKSKWFDKVFIDYLDIYSLTYLNEYNTSAYSNKLFDSFTLFDLNLKYKRYEEAYFFSIEYLNNISLGFKNINLDSNLNSKFKISISENIDKVIDFYVSNNKSKDAINAISIYKIQQFHDAIQRTGLDHKVTYNNKNDLLRKKIANNIAEIEYINPENTRINEPINRKKLDSIKSSLKQELQIIYADTKINNDNLNSKNIKSNEIPTNSLYVDYYLKSEKLNIILSSSYGSRIIATPIPIDFNRQIIKLLSLYNNPNTSKIEIEELNKFLFSYLFDPIFSEVSDKKLEKIYFRSNGLLPLLPFKNILSSNKKINKFINLAYEGIDNRSKNLTTTRFHNSSLFATDQKFENLPPLKFAKTEVELIKGIFDGNLSKLTKNKIFINSTFTLENLLTEFKSNANIIHIASHYSYNNSGSLLLGNGNLVSAQKLWNSLPKSINSKLITISACESGLIFEEGKIFENLPNVFLDKGASLVVASKWKIADESTSYFMEIFYKLLIETNDPIVSLNVTQVVFQDSDFELLEKNYNIILNNSIKSNIKKYSHPFYWASFQIVSPKQ